MTLITFHGQTFTTKKAVQAYITDIVRSIDIGEVIDDKHRHFGLFLEIVGLHQDGTAIHARGLHYFLFIRGPQWGEKQLNAVCADKTAYVLTCQYSKLVGEKRATS